MNQNQRRVVRDVMAECGKPFWRRGDVEDGTSNVFLVDDIIHNLNSVGLDLELKEIKHDT